MGRADPPQRWPVCVGAGVDDIAAATSTFRDRGIVVDGPTAYERRREDGVLVEWDLTFLGDGDPGSLLPFLISDRTPRTRRVQPTGDLASAPVSGVDSVIVGVRDLAAAVDRLRTALDLDAPVRGSVERLHADVAVFGDAPVALASPRDDGWLAERLEAFGPLPVAYLLGSDPGVTDRFDDLETGSMAGRRVDWLPLTDPVGRRYLGLVGHTTEAGPRGEGRT
nr:VOC family protein [Halopenitus persicus]